MSFSCRVVHTALLVRTLQRMCIARDPWLVALVRDDAVLFHAVSDDQSVVATATVPPEVFADLRVHAAGDAEPRGGTGSAAVRLTLHAAALVDALTLGSAVPSSHAAAAAAAAAAFGGPSLYATTQVLLTYPAAGGRLQVQLRDENRVLQSSLVVRASKDVMPDPRFKAWPTVNYAVLRSEGLREALGSIVAMQCDTVALRFAPHEVTLTGAPSPFGSATMTLHAGGDAVLSLSCGDSALTAKFLCPHIALAAGLGLSGPRGGRSGGGATFRGGGSSMAGGGGGSGASDPFSAAHSFAKVLVRVNAERQLCVTHQAQDYEPPVQLTIVVSPLAPTLDDVLS